ncbi:MAG: carboxypeptidase-like regulatory domain-containing protein [Planctomycetota bacterium]
MTLERPCRLSGKVIDGDGEACAGAFVESVTHTENQCHVRADATTTRTGEFCLQGVPAGKVTVTACRGRDETWGRAPVPGEASKTYHLEPGAAITGLELRLR